MAELARGTIADRPWGRTVAALALRGLSGQLTVAAERKHYQIAFHRGAVVGAGSPIASDAAVRIAMTGGLISSTQVADLVRRQVAAPDRDEIELLAELVRLSPEQALRLRRRVVAQRAARTFSVERGEFVVEDEVTVPVVPGAELDVRAVIYLGARQNLSEGRLNGELARFGAYFQLGAEGAEDLPQFGFSATEQPVIARLAAGASLAELEGLGVEPRVVRALLYALVACGACEASAHQMPPPPRPSQIDLPTTRRANDLDPATVRRPAMAPPAPAHLDPPTVQRAPLRKTDERRTAETLALIERLQRAIAEDADYFTLLGVAEDTPPAAIRKIYFGLARQLHPDRLAALGIFDDTRAAQALFAQVNAAFATLSNDEQRAAYVDVLRRGGAAAARRDEQEAEALATRILDSEEAFRRGELALRRDDLPAALAELARAIELNTDEPDYHATLAWAQFCAAPDKAAVAAATRRALDHAILQRPRAILARFYLGRVERMLGNDPDALRHFQDVLNAHPHHAEAASELRALQARSASPTKSGGLFGRLKR